MGLRHVRMAARAQGAPNTRMRWRLMRVLLWKFAGLGVLWYLFFSQAHRPSVDAAALSRQLALAPAAATRPLMRAGGEGRFTHD